MGLGRPGKAGLIGHFIDECAGPVTQFNIRAAPPQAPAPWPQWHEAIGCLEHLGSARDDGVSPGGKDGAGREGELDAVGQPPAREVNGLPARIEQLHVFRRLGFVGRGVVDFIDDDRALRGDGTNRSPEAQPQRDQRDRRWSSGGKGWSRICRMHDLKVPEGRRMALTRIFNPIFCGDLPKGGLAALAWHSSPGCRSLCRPAREATRPWRQPAFRRVLRGGGMKYPGQGSAWIVP